MTVHGLLRVMRLSGFRHFKGDAQTCKTPEGICTKVLPYPLSKIIDGLRLKLDATEASQPARPATARFQID